MFRCTWYSKIIFSLSLSPCIPIYICHCWRFCVLLSNFWIFRLICVSRRLRSFVCMCAPLKEIEIHHRRRRRHRTVFHLIPFSFQYEIILLKIDTLSWTYDGHKTEKSQSQCDVFVLTVLFCVCIYLIIGLRKNKRILWFLWLIA